MSAIAGSDVVVEGRGGASRIQAMLGDSALATQASGPKWQVRFRMPAGALALRLADGAAERLVTIEPYPDSVPVVALRIPARDTVFRVAAGTIPLAADASDDIGLGETLFEYIVTSGEMESFTFRTGTVQRGDAGGAPVGRTAGVAEPGNAGPQAGGHRAPARGGDRPEHGDRAGARLVRNPHHPHRAPGRIRQRGRRRDAVDARRHRRAEPAHAHHAGRSARAPTAATGPRHRRRRVARDCPSTSTAASLALPTSSSCV